MSALLSAIPGGPWPWCYSANVPCTSQSSYASPQPIVLWLPNHGRRLLCLCMQAPVMLPGLLRAITSVSTKVVKFVLQRPNCHRHLPSPNMRLSCAGGSPVIHRGTRAARHTLSACPGLPLPEGVFASEDVVPRRGTPLPGSCEPPFGMLASVPPSCDA